MTEQAGQPVTEPLSQRGVELLPRRMRLVVFAVLVLIALGSIWVIDRRAMELMHRDEQKRAESGDGL